MITELQQEMIDEVMDSFDFRRVAEVMEKLDWSWGSTGRIPDDSELRSTARRLLKGSLKSGLCATGGFHATYSDGLLGLAFQVTDWSVYVDDKEIVVPS